IIASLRKYKKEIEDYLAPTKQTGKGPNLTNWEDAAKLSDCLAPHAERLSAIGANIASYLVVDSPEQEAFLESVTLKLAEEYFDLDPAKESETQEKTDGVVCEAVVEGDEVGALVAASLDVGTFDPLDLRILQKIQENISAFNVNMQNAPPNFKGYKTRVAYGRKWNPLWAFDQIDKMYPDFWSADNKTKILSGRLPTVDEKYLQVIGKGLSPDDFSKLKAVAAIDKPIQHHHMNHGNFAVSLETTIHTGPTNTKFWHNPKFRNVASRTIKSMSSVTAKSLLIIGFAISIHEVLSGDLSGAVSSMSGLPQNSIIEDVSINLVQEGLMGDIYEKVKIGLSLLEDKRFTVGYWSADELLNYLDGKAVEDKIITQNVDEQWAKDFAYLIVRFEGKMVGIVNIPD
ncbi:MAG: hypothetical protein ACK5V5_10380, partial [Cyclobacteriaceae bacterium]